MNSPNEQWKFWNQWLNLTSKLRRSDISIICWGCVWTFSNLEYYDQKLVRPIKSSKPVLKVARRDYFTESPSHGCHN